MASTPKSKEDLGVTYKDLRSANSAAREELKHARAASKAVIRLLKDQLTAESKCKLDFVMNVKL